MDPHGFSERLIGSGNRGVPQQLSASEAYVIEEACDSCRGAATLPFLVIAFCIRSDQLIIGGNLRLKIISRQVVIE